VQHEQLDEWGVLCAKVRTECSLEEDWAVPNCSAHCKQWAHIRVTDSKSTGGAWLATWRRFPSLQPGVEGQGIGEPLDRFTLGV
jgi:hypothetical protein